MDDKALRILVVDDHQDSADGLAILLEQWGHVLVKAYDGPTAIAIAHGFQPDIIFLDIAMPGMDGYEVARQLRSQLPGSNIRIIAVTGYGRGSDVNDAYEAGFDCHLLKPVEAKTLKTVLGVGAIRRAKTTPQG